MAQIISNEIPSGLVNGVNKVYTTNTQIYSIISLNVDGVEYYDFIISGNAITLTDAPTLSIYVDYLTVGYSVNPSSNKTLLADIKGKIRQEMEQNSDSVTYSSQRLTDMVNEVTQEILEGKVSNELTGKFIQGNLLDFNTGRFACNILNNLTITTQITTASIIVEMDTTILPTTGAVLIGDEVVEYTGKTATEITGVTGILSTHSAGSVVIPLYTNPSDLWKPTKAYQVINNVQKELEYKDSNGQLMRYYEILNGKYVFFYGVLSSSVYYIEYTKEYVRLTLDTQETVLSDYIAMNVVPFIAGGRLIKDEILRVKLLTQGYNKIATEFAKAGEQMGKPKGISWKRFGFSSLRR